MGGERQPGQSPRGWNVAGIGDLNGDGHSDVLFHDPSTGRVDEWVLVNGHWTASIDLGTHPGSGWNIAGIGDFTGSGQNDVLWHQFGPSGAGPRSARTSALPQAHRPPAPRELPALLLLHACKSC
jgi:hypothetical protein